MTVRTDWKDEDLRVHTSSDLLCPCGGPIAFPVKGDEDADWTCAKVLKGEAPEAGHYVGETTRKQRAAVALNERIVELPADLAEKIRAVAAVSP